MSRNKEIEDLVQMICEAVKNISDYSTLQMIYIIIQQTK